MAILAYQLFIVFTIAITRLAARQNLVAICLVWTAFTFLNVFISPLLLLQLFTIWGAYALLKGREGPPEVAAVDVVAIRAELQSEKCAAGPKGTGADELEQFARWVALRRNVRSATAQLQATLRKERTVIEHALSSAKAKRDRDIYLAGLSSSHRGTYMEELNALNKIFDDSGTVDIGTLIIVNDPKFGVSQAKADGQVAAAIHAKEAELRSKREAFLCDTADRLSKGDLWSYFFDELNHLVEPFAASRIFWSLTSIGLSKFISAKFPVGKTGDCPSDVAGAGRSKVERSCSTTADGIKARAEELQLPYLLHFTHIDNLTSILQHGLCPIAMLDHKDATFRANDTGRWDGHRDASCLSVAHPNDKMFAKYRWNDLEQDWVVLVVNRSILWTTRAGFTRHNAARNSVRRQPLSDLMTTSAFEAMFLPFGDPPKREHFLEPYDPTDVQAEVLVFGVVPSELIDGIVFGSARVMEAFQGRLGRRRASVHTEGRGFFGARSYVRQKGWTY